MFFEFLEKRKINVVNVEAEEFIEAFNRIIAFLLSSNRQICPSQVMLVKRSISLGDFNVMNVLDDVKNEDGKSEFPNFENLFEHISFLRIFKVSRDAIGNDSTLVSCNSDLYILIIVKRKSKLLF